MALTQKLELRQGQALVMTPQLQQAIKLLQLSNLDLCAFVEQELERNPLLERDDVVEASGETEFEPAPDSMVGEPLESALASDDFSKADELDAEREDVFAEEAPSPASALERTDWTSLRSAAPGSGSENLLDRTLAKTKTLQDHLHDQLAIAGLDAAQILIGTALIDAIDEAGYLRCETGEIASRLGAEEPVVEAVLGAIQGFDPTGVGARNLSECLALQLRERGRLDPAMSIFLSHLDLVARRDFDGLGARCGVDAEDVSDMIAELRTLVPKPGLAFGCEPVQPVIPDIFVREAPDGSWLVELNAETLPRILVNERYYARVSGATQDKGSKIWLADCYNSANWLVKSLHQRARTILKVSAEIVRRQDSFLAHGVRHLRPLNLRTIAEAISMHESTVSRVTSNKYMATPRGTFELKYFFTAAIQATNGSEAHSAESVRDRIRDLIGTEAPEHVLSDDAIVTLLTGDGIDIARRTVAKYREAMRIPSSVERKRLRHHASGARENRVVPA